MTFVLIGESASGKSTIERRLNSELELNRIISYTTRPMRDGEQNEVDYHFITEDHFIELVAEGFFAELVTYRDWHYAIAKEDMTDDSIVVVEPTGLRQLIALPDINVTSFYIKADIRTRMKRMLDRGDDISEIFRRTFSDQGGFNGIADEVDFVIENEDSHINYAFHEIKKIINAKKGD